ncbi:T9SS type A sorting domain-containing protein [Flavitalea sp.]
MAGRFKYSFVVSATLSRKEVQQIFYYEQASDKIQPRSLQPAGNIRVVRIFYAAGRLIKSSYEFQRGISMSDCPPGIYILQVSRSRQQLISKIVKL